MFNAPKNSRFIKGFNETEYMYFLIEDNELLEKLNNIWDKVSNSVKKEFHSEPLCNEKYLKSRGKKLNSS